MLFDSHVHFFPDKLLGKVFPKLSKIAGYPYYADEKRDSALQLLESQGGTHCLALHIATNPAQQTSVNNFAAQSQGDNMLCFGSVHPLAENVLEELYRIKELGLRGVKMHPDYQEFFAGNEAYFPIYETCQKLGLPIAFHAGRDPYSPDVVHCPPAVIRKIADAYPSLSIIAAHMGGLGMMEEVKKELCGVKNVYFDTAFASHFLNAEELRELIRLHGSDKVFFATDAPWSTIDRERNLLEAAGLTADEKDAIYYKNACRFFELGS